MAYTNVQSGEIPEGTQYYSGKLPLGEYNFYLSVDATGVSPKIVSKCVSPDGETRTAASRTWPAGTQITGWSVEANETEATVYAKLKSSGGGSEIISENFVGYYFGGYGPSEKIATFNGFGTSGDFGVILASSSPMNAGSYTYDGKTVYYYAAAGTFQSYLTPEYSTILNTSAWPSNLEKVAWDMIYKESLNDGDYIIGRFAINLGDAGGYPGGGGGWISPGDWNPDPTTTLHLTVNGALSGRHNDPLADPGYSYLPADNMAVAGYGCGGDGGHGGGGGGGASTISVRQFATNKANSKVILVLAKRHGYGSGGGKGRKGGDGCILIYY